MKEFEKDVVKHALDVWHVVKTMLKWLTRACTKKVCALAWLPAGVGSLPDLTTIQLSKIHLGGTSQQAQKALLGWLPDLKTHVWWSVANCGGDAELLVEMIKSVAYHVTNRHSNFGPGFTKFTRCQHDPLEE